MTLQTPTHSLLQPFMFVLTSRDVEPQVGWVGRGEQR